MKEKWEHITDAGSCPEMERLILYHEGKLSGDERFAIENHLAGCDMCNDILEGYSLLKNKTSLANAESDLKQRVHRMLHAEKGKIRILPVYRKMMVAASILLLLGFGTFLYLKIKPSNHELASIPAIDKKMISHEELKSTPVIISENNKKINQEVIVNKKQNQVQKTRKVADKNFTGIVKPDEQIYPMDEVLSESNDIKAGRINDTIKSEVITLSSRAGMIQEKSKDYFFKKSELSGPTTISGVVTDKSGQPIPGVNVLVKGSKTGTITDIDGKFNININSSAETLVFNYVGYNTEEIVASNKSELKVSMVENITALNEVVVIGYGVQKKKDETGSISVINMDDINNNSSPIQGRVAGVSVTENQDKEEDLKSLKESVKSDPQNKVKIKSLALKYIDLQNQFESTEQLISLQQLTSDSIQYKELADIIELVHQGRCHKALNRLRKMKF